ncbi:galactokinase [Streptomyces sp. H27-D2]|uniref:galactokinase n=1 Tax=Streptomyces sp. H27-D2 TaxID=3046304 RepID=UPI002DC0059E|nr:galactokinase [Streptomyces sp. H27-D2]MEC4019934.1 galactokinase [Streptomyces sp. H27-D2]
MPDLARRPAVAPLVRLAAYALESDHGRRPATVWSAPYTFHLGSPRLVAAVHWSVVVAAAPRDDGTARLSSAADPAQGCELPLTGRYPPPPGWAVRVHTLLRAMAHAGYGRGGLDLHVQAALPAAAGLAGEESLACAVALAVADLHAASGAPRPSHARLAALVRAGARGGGDALRRGVLSARPGTALRLTERTQTYVSFDPAESGDRLVLLATRGERRAAHAGHAVDRALRAGARRAWWPAVVPGRSAVLLMPHDRLPAVRTAVTEDFRARGRAAPRFVNLTVAGAARREG